MLKLNYAAALRAAFAVCALLALAPAASAQRYGYSFPYGGKPRASQNEAPRQYGQNEPGVFDYYALVLSWSPSYCAGVSNPERDPQCQVQAGKRYSFVLHGLWPQYEKGYPGDCFTGKPTFVPQPVVDGMLDIMPSKRLVIHEYQKHGTCSGLAPEAYFGFARKVFARIKVPARYLNVTEAQFVSPAQLIGEFAKENPTVPEAAFAVSCGRPGNKIVDLHVCLNKSGSPRACGKNEYQRKLCSADKMYVPPVRASANATGPTPGRGSQPQLPPGLAPSLPVAPGQRAL